MQDSLHHIEGRRPYVSEHYSDGNQKSGGTYLTGNFTLAFHDLLTV